VSEPPTPFWGTHPAPSGRRSPDGPPEAHGPPAA
jgi:hypothetical protein